MAVLAHAALLRQACAHCGRFPTAASRRSLGRVSVPVWPITLSGRLRIVALVSRYLTNQLMRRGPIRKWQLDAAFPPRIMRSGVLSGISPGFPELSRSCGQVTHVLLTRSPLGLKGQALQDPARLACIRHAASVRPEPGSSSPGKFDMTQRNHGSFSLFSFQGTPSFFLRRTSRRRILSYHGLRRLSTTFFGGFCSNPSGLFFRAETPITLSRNQGAVNPEMIANFLETGTPSPRDVPSLYSEIHSRSSCSIVFPNTFLKAARVRRFNSGILSALSRSIVGYLRRTANTSPIFSSPYRSMRNRNRAALWA